MGTVATELLETERDERGRRAAAAPFEVQLADGTIVRGSHVEEVARLLQQHFKPVSELRAVLPETHGQCEPSTGGGAAVP